MIKVLLIDDNVSFLKALIDDLKEPDIEFEYLDPTDVPEELRGLASQTREYLREHVPVVLRNEKIDLALLDYSFGNGNYGIDIVDLFEDAQVPVIAFSSYDEHNKTLMKYGAISDFNKTRKPRELPNIIRETIKNYNSKPQQ